MVAIKKKKIKGKIYRYASKSLRLPNGKIVTIEKILKKDESPESNEVNEFLLKKEVQIFTKYAIESYKTGSVFTQEQISKIEEMKVGYKRIIRRLTKRQLQDIFDRFTINFTYESNALEGNSLTLKDVAIIIEDNIVPKDKDLREVYDTRNSRKVVDLILKKKFRISEKDIVKMHAMLVKDMGIATGYKRVPNFIVGRNLSTTSPELVGKEIKELVSWVNENPEKSHPLQVAARAHGKFERIHPFEDGNGRVGRFLINVILVNNNYPPLIIRKTQRVNYLKSLEDFDNRHTITLERFLMGRYKATFRKFFEIYIEYVK